jgi:hypothetical protein
MQLASVSDTKAFLEISSATHDTLLDTLLTQISKRVETFLNRELEKKARTAYFNAGRSKYFLPAYPIDSSVGLVVTVDGVAQVYEDNYYVWFDDGYVEFSITPSYTKPRGVVIGWTGGYAAADVPADIQMATIMQVSFVFRRRKDIGLSSISLPDGSIGVNAPTELLPEVKSVLKSYRKTPGGR